MQSVPRLITNFKPSRYILSIDLSGGRERTFQGVVDISGELQPGHSDISLHAKDLTIDSVLIDGKTAVATPGEYDELRISQEGLTPGEHLVTIAFHATITDAMHGLYPCYFEHDGQKKELFATQFESHHAREAFPCVDEPEAKATFEVTLTTTPAITVLSNQPVKWQREENDLLVTNFQTTPRMSTYLLAWVVGELHKKSTTTTNGIEVNVWATPAQKPESLDFALDIAARTIDFYEAYFATPYPLAKSDHVALPDFSSGAMENWGLITYREIALLADPKTTSISTKQYIATVVAHELAHMWFGNLVTMKWWNNLWLNESFATMIEYLAVDHLHPEWNLWLDFSSNESIMALRRDAIDGVQSVQVDVHHPDEISSLFDGAIVYAKGARLLRMLQHYVGNEAFQTGLRQYFADFAYQNTEGDDLWNAISKASGKDITSMMNTWISQSGYPVVRVTQVGDEVTLEQDQFFIGPHEPSERLWPIPLNASSPDAPELMTTKKLTFTYSDSEPLRLNVGDTAHFITQYDEALFAAHVERIKSGTTEPLDRLQLLHETTLLVRGGKLPSAQLLPLIRAYRDETSEPVWGVISIALAELRKFVDTDSAAEVALRKTSRDIATKQYERLGWIRNDYEPEEDSKLRSTILSLMLYGEHPEALATARMLYENNSLEDLDPELRSLIISSVVRHGDGSEVEALLATYKTTTNVDLAQDIAVGITSTRIPKNIDVLLAAMKNPDIVRPQDVFRWFAYLIGGRDSRTQTWQWLQHNWQWVVETFGGDKSYDDFPRYAANGLVTRAELEEYIAFFQPKASIAALTRTISLGIAEIQGRVELIERDKDAVVAALIEHA